MRASGPYDQGRLPVAALRVDGAHRHCGRCIASSSQPISDAAARSPDRAKLRGETRRSSRSRRGTSISRGCTSRMRETQLAGRADVTLTSAQAVGQSRARARRHHAALRRASRRTVDRRARVSRRCARRRSARHGAARRSTGTAAVLGRSGLRALRSGGVGTLSRGSINGTVSAKGTLAGPQADVESRDPRFAAGSMRRSPRRGTLSLAGERLRHADRRSDDRRQPLLRAGRARRAEGRRSTCASTRRGSASSTSACRAALRGTAQVSGTLARAQPCASMSRERISRTTRTAA